MAVWFEVGLSQSISAGPLLSARVAAWVEKRAELIQKGLFLGGERSDVAKEAVSTASEATFS